MSFSNWLQLTTVRRCLIVVLLLLLSGPIFGQQVGDGGETRPAERQEPPKPDKTPLVLDAIQNTVERFTRAIEAHVNKPKPAEEDERARSDLRAQEDMAFWAMLMFFATGVSVALTGFGVFLIWRTLVYSRDAADAAKAMVVEGENATKAALTAANEAKRQADLFEQSFKRLERPYIFPSNLSRIIPPNPARPAHISCSIGNYGRTPAIVHYIRFGFGPLPDEQPSDPGSPFKSIPNDRNEGVVIPSGEVRKDLYHAYFPAIVALESDNKGRITPKIQGHPHVYFVMNTKFEDPLGVIREGRFTWRYDKSLRQFLRHGGKEYNYERETDS